ncbi:Kelch repeat-containing protein [Chitinimonas sp.]|uniref:Kelch repeat-containing protein n=1 Tax=Chitinimonas sp. TaxID=1934313 RepID=UPI002F941833
MGEVATLIPTFTGSVARIEPGIGVVKSGVAVKTSPLTDATQYRLILGQGNSAPVATVNLAVDFRNSYRTAATGFPIVQQATTLLSDGSVLVSGGNRGDGGLSTQVNRYDMASQSWSQVATLQNGRSEHQMTLLSSGKLLITGGNRSLANGATAELLDLNTGISQALGAMRSSRIGHVATALRDGRVLITGGRTADASSKITNTAELWDPVTQVFTPTATPMGTARSYHSASLLPNDKVLIAGGYTDGNNAQYTEVFDPANNSFSPLPGGPAELPAAQLALTKPDTSIWLLGGVNQTTSASFKSAYQYVPGSATVAALPDLPTSVGYSAGIALGSGDVLMFGGLIDATTTTGQAFRISATGGKTIATMPLARYGHTAQRLSDGRVLIFGGTDQQGRLQSNVLIYE